MIAYFLLNNNSSPSPPSTATPTPRILLLEARTLCSGATGRNGGHTKAGSYRSYVPDAGRLGREEALKMARMAHANIRATHELAEELGIQCENQVCDTVDVVYNTTVFENGKRAVEALRRDVQEEKEKEGEWWVGRYEVFEGWEQVKRAGLYLADKNENEQVQGEERVVGAFKYRAGRVHAYRFTTGVLERCVKKGLEIATNTPVKRIRKEGQEDKGEEEIWEIETPRGTICTRQVIVATNGYTANLLPELQGAIVPLRGQITAQRPGKATTLRTPLECTYSFDYGGGYEYMIPRPLADGSQHIVIGGGIGRLEDHGVTEFGTVNDAEINPLLSKYLRGSAMGFFGRENWGGTNEMEHDDEERVVHEWTGIMGVTADSMPFVGQVPGKKGMWMSAGFNGHGMVLCLKAAEALTSMILNGGGGGAESVPSWFPISFLVTQERLRNAQFKGLAELDKPVPYDDG